MHMTFLAPELSATSHTVLGCIMDPLSLHRCSFHYIHHLPMLCFAQRPRLYDLYLISNMAPLILIMGHKLCPSLDHFSIFGMPVKTLDQHRNGLFHLVTDHLADIFFSPIVRHPSSPYPNPYPLICRSLITVFILAISFRTCLIRIGFSTPPLMTF